MARKILAVVVFIAVMTALVQFGWWVVDAFGWWGILALIPVTPFAIWLAHREDRRVETERRRARDYP